MMDSSLLVVDDDPSIIDSITSTIGQHPNSLLDNNSDNDSLLNSESDNSIWHISIGYDTSIVQKTYNTFHRYSDIDEFNSRRSSLQIIKDRTFSEQLSFFTIQDEKDDISLSSSRNQYSMIPTCNSSVFSPNSPVYQSHLPYKPTENLPNSIAQIRQVNDVNIHFTYNKQSHIPSLSNSFKEQCDKIKNIFHTVEEINLRALSTKYFSIHNLSISPLSM